MAVLLTIAATLQKSSGVPKYLPCWKVSNKIVDHNEKQISYFIQICCDEGLEKID
jgi:hypothetical protein